MIKDHTAILPTPITDEFEERYFRARNEIEIKHFLNNEMVMDAAHANVSRDVIRSHEQLERDAMSMALHLYGDELDTMAPETAEVMARWHPRVKALLEEQK